MPIFTESVSSALTFGSVPGFVNSTRPRSVRSSTRDRWLTQLIYAMKTNRPTLVDWYRITFHGVDLDTGQKITRLKKQRLRKAVVLPMSLDRRVWGLGQIPEFQNKGIVSQEVTTVLLDARDVGLRWVPPTVEDYFIFDGGRWDVLLSTNYMNRLFIVYCVETVGQEIVRIEEAHNGLVLEDGIV